MSTRGELKTFSFTVRVVRDWASLREAAFDGAWRAMRDRFYDPSMNNRDWDTIRRKYRGVAKECLGAEEFSSLVNMMLGELNASHMGHRGGSGPTAGSSSTSSWADKTQSIGLRYTMSDAGALVTSVIPRSPCSQSRSMMRAGDTVTAIDGLQLSKANDIDRMLTRDSIREIVLSVTAEDGANREVKVTPVSSISGLLYDEWVSDNRRSVDSLSGGKLGYLHIRSMNMSSLRDMEEDLFDAGHGKDGLVIDVRFNGGGSTTDHVLTVLTQPEHAITVSPGSGEGYPQDRKVYASWKKPIVLMCNEHSFSNAEILAHAIKHLKRGRVVGMRTAGGVISTGSARLIDGSSVRMPTRGWFLKGDGADMELNGCEPDICLWNKPGGRDDQLREAVRALAEDVKTAAETPRVKPTRAAELRK
jgi:tricorn protease